MVESCDATILLSSKMKKHNIMKCYVFRNQVTTDMEGFYEKCGIKPIDKLKNYVGDIDTILMEEI